MAPPMTLMEIFSSGEAGSSDCLAWDTLWAAYDGAPYTMELAIGSIVASASTL